MVDWNQVSSIVTAIRTSGLALFAYWSFKGLKDQMNLLKRQADSMARQADIMGLNLRKERLFKEIDSLIKPLYEEFQPKRNVDTSHYPRDSYKLRADFMSNKYLGSKALREAIGKFYDIVDKNSNVPSARDDLFLAVKTRYEEIQKELDAIDMKLDKED